MNVLFTLDAESIQSCVTDPPYGLGFMGKKWDVGDISFQPETWAAVARVLKPGAHLLAFGGTRTFHRLAVAIEDAGFEIRDTVMWVYGSGFPKSHNVANSLDKMHGAANRGHAIASGSKYHPTTGKARAPGDHLDPYEARTEQGKGWEGWGTALKPAWEPIIVARKPLIGTVAENVAAHRTGALNIDGCRVPGAKPDTTRGAGGQHGRFSEIGAQGRIIDDGRGRWPANLIHDGSDEVLAAFPDSNGSGHARVLKRGKRDDGWGMADAPGELRDAGTGSAARFFYCAKASKSDRNDGCEKNNHPTVKPTELMRYLCRLVTPPGGTVLDPFMGSGSTGRGAVMEGLRFIGIEREAEYLEIAKARIAACQK